MKINAICMVKNEADIILEALSNALHFCHRIYVFDNGSTDGTSELLDEFIFANPSVVLAERSDEVFKNQLRNRVYNQYHHLYSADDWWYILDADELLTSNPKAMLEQASRQGRDTMRVWQAQFYFTDHDLAHFEQEDTRLPVTQRRRYYRINWREVRFFKNHPDKKWPEIVSGRIPPFCGKYYAKSPICCHYAQRTPEQIQQRINIRIDNPYSFFHLKKGNANSQASWLKQADTLFYYNGDACFKFPLQDKLIYFSRELGYWLGWRFKQLNNKAKQLLNLAVG